MSWSYSGNPGDSALDGVRFLVGDTNTQDQQLQDGEINFLVATYTNIYKAAAYAAEAIGSKYARLVDKSVGDLRVSYSQRQAQYQKLRDQLLKQSSSRTSFPYGGGISKSDKEILRLDPDAVKPDFTKDQFRFKGSGIGPNGPDSGGPGGGFSN